MEERDNCDKSLLSQEKLNLKSWGLPKMILEKYLTKGITNMFPWQVECLTQDGVLSGRNLVYSAPTSAGKTMVAEILTIQTVLERKKKVIFILPFVSVVREKMLYFQNLLGSSGVRVEGFMGSHAPPGGLRTVHIAVCTIEKANSLVNRLLEDQGLDAVGCVVVDELHLLGDPHRGYLLELLLTKLKFMCRKDKTLKIQVVGMSATLPNVEDLAGWLDAALYTTQFRPIPLTEYLKVNSSVYDASTLELKYDIKPITKFKSDPGDVIHLCLESLLAGHSVLVFCPTRGWCETSAQQIAAEFRRIGYEKSELGLAVRGQLVGAAISEVLELLRRSPAGLDSALGRSVAFGVAFHHAGLTMDERDIVEGAFRNGVLRVLVATSTLSSGVNLPARRVLIRCPPRNMGCDVRSYRQMVGRAGRMGKDTAGESFLICNGSERLAGEQLVRARLPSVESSLGAGDLSSSLKRAVLEVIASGVVNTSEDVELYTSCTFLASSSDGDSSLADPLACCVEYLQTNEFIRVSGDTLGPTPLAEACLSASLPPDQGLKLLKELHRARQCFVLETELHVIYQVTPYSVSDQWGELDWLRVLSLWEDLPISMKRVGELVGVEERFLVGAVRGTVNMNNNNAAQKLSVHRRFYTALALQDLVNEVPLPQVAVKFNCSKGVLQSLQQSASTFAGMVTQFTRRLGWSNVELLVSQFGARLQFGAQRELLDLLRLDCLTALQARALYNCGIQALADLATASVSKVERALARATPFQSEQDGERERGGDKCCIWLVGRCAVSETQAADILVREARQYLERELGLQSANWGDLNATLDSSTASDVSLTQPGISPAGRIGLDNKENGAAVKENGIAVRENGAVKENVAVVKENGATVKKNIGVFKGKDTEEEENYLVVQDRVEENETDIGGIKLIGNCDKHPSLNNDGQNESNSKSSVIKGEIQCVKSNCNIIENVDAKINSTPRMNIDTPNVIHKKRGSLDLFDSPDHIITHNQEETNGSDTNIGKEKKTLSSYELGNNQMFCNKENVQMENETKDVNEACESEHIKHNECSETLSSQIPNICFSSGIVPSKSNFVPEDDMFVDSPKRDDMNAALEKMDANVGGESLLEMSSFVSENDPGGCINLENIDLWGSNTGGDSFLLGVSSLIALTEERKRKRSIDNTNISKRLKPLTPRNTSQLQGTPDTNELQVSQISSTNSNLKPVKTSTPSLSQYFEGSINFDSPFLINDRVDHQVTEGSPNNDLFADSNENIANNISNSMISNNGNKSSSFELKLSPEPEERESLNDCVLNVNSKIFDELESKDNENAGRPVEKEFSNVLSFNGGVSFSKLNERSKEQDDAMQKLPNQIEGESDKIIPKMISLKSDVNKCLFQDSFIVDSKLDALIDVEVNDAKKINNNFNSSQFSTNLSLNSQLCKLIDGKNIVENKGLVDKPSGGNYSEQFENNEFTLNTQICNLIDNVATETKCRQSEWTESMEVREIENLNLDDEDTVYGTPVSHQRSTLFKKPFRNKTKRENPTQLTKNDTVNFNFARKREITTMCVRDNVSKSNQIVLEHSENIQGHLISDKENVLAINKEVKAVPQSSEKIKISMTQSCLEHAFDETFNLESQEVDEVLSSQKTPVTPHKTFRERVQNVDSPTVNKSRSQVEVVSVKDDASRQLFRSEVMSRQCVSLVLTTSSAEGEGSGRIGARFVSKTSEPNYPCCHQGMVVTAAVVCASNSHVYVVCLSQENCTANLEVLREMVSRKELVVCSWEVKRTVRQLMQCCQLQCRTRLSDPTVAEWLLKPHQPTPSLKQMARSYGVSAPQCSAEAGFTAVLVWELCSLLRAKLKQCGLYKAYKEVEMPTQQVLADMEVEGVRWDRDYAELLWTATEDKMADLQNTLYSLAGTKFNLRSRADLAKVKKVIKESCEQKLEEFNKVLHNWRVLNSLKTRNMSALLMQDSERVHGTWETHTVTGRISMQEPNLQHVPRDFTVDDQVFSLRSAFTAGPGHELVSADYSQLELRLLAHFSQDSALLATFARPGDVFTAIAAEWHHIPQEQVGPELRQHTKQLCYGLVYGMGLASLAEEMGVEEARAGEMAESFHRAYPGLRAYMGRCVAACRASSDCHVTTLLSRRRLLPNISSQNRALRAQAERQAVNTTIQGSAADIAKTAMLRVRQASLRHKLSARLVIHLHDELIYEVAQHDVQEFVKILRKEMEGAIVLSVPLPVKVKKGPSWGQLELID